MSKKVGTGFWWLWLTANTCGSFFLPILIWQDPYEIRSRIFLNAILQGTGMAIMQSSLLRSHISKRHWWFPLTMIGWIAGLSIISLFPSLGLHEAIFTEHFLTTLLLDFLIVGFIVGTLQWQLLRKFSAGSAWLLVSPLALSCSALGLYWGYKIPSSLLSTTIATGLQGLIYSAITGLFAIKILRSPKSKPKTQQPKANS
ncbi:MAG: hypothetical protein NW214_00470 [Pseudanabaenaceae cyanobacterium bins.39]|nr:hypothetical protein [Pseudanabaenaceae cyanobacterium bins.39]